MPKRMLIDATHPEETRVVVLDGNKVEEFDFEAASKRPLKGNIYLAKVTRVEPSLQAAFVEYGGNRQGFLAFSEIHPDYYQIPVADREALIAEQQAEARRRQEDDIESFDIGSGPKTASGSSEEEEIEESVSETVDAAEAIADEKRPQEDEPPGAAMATSLPTEDGTELPESALIGEPDATDPTAPLDNAAVSSTASDPHERSDDEDAVFEHRGVASADDDEADEDDEDADELTPPSADDIQTIANEERQADIVDQQTVAAAELEAHPSAEMSELPSDLPQLTGQIVDQQTASQPADHETEHAEPHSQALQAQRPSQRWVRKRHYKIQEVIKRRQIILVQVVKEERGNKGAALTTYLSLAGRYCVLMPNTPRGGGISRKITNMNDRKRLKEAAQALELPEGMGLIIRTAGENRTKVEIKRDYEYLLRLWDTIRENTLNSHAPACVHEEGDLIKRAIRDLYNKDVTEVIVEGEAGYRNAKDFMRMLMPSHAKNVKPYQEPIPLFQRYHIESQLDAMFSPTVTLKSGGYIVINQTEALVAIDVNSGRATREHSIEETARKTNLEAAEEIGRQLRLRDLAGLIVIDFIDMEESRNDRDVEKCLRDAVKNDRARIQIGKISQFGLLEMSRQRLRAGVIAGSTVPCPHCGGQGIVRSVESTSLRVLRALEEEAQKQRAEALTVRVANDVAIYTLNQKRRELSRLENEFAIAINFEPSEDMVAGEFDIERIGHRNPETFVRPPPVQPSDVDREDDEVTDAEDELPAETDEAESDTAAETENESDGHAQDRRDGDSRRRRRRRGGRNRHRDREPTQVEAKIQPETTAEAVESPAEADELADVVEGGEALAAEGSEAATNGQPANGQPANGDGQRRRRRRRRGRRGSTREAFGESGEQSTQQPGEEQRTSAPIGFGYDRFGVLEEIDTTPRDEPRAAPNAASAPSWSLTEPEEIDTTPRVPLTPQAEQQSVPREATEHGDSAATLETIDHAPDAAAASPALSEVTQPAAPSPQVEVTKAPDVVPQDQAPSPAPAEAAATLQPVEAQQPAEPALPPRKGWWQRKTKPD